MDGNINFFPFRHSTTAKEAEVRLTRSLALIEIHCCQINYRILSRLSHYLYEGSDHGPEAAGWVSSPEQQVGPGLLNAVDHLRPA